MKSRYTVRSGKCEAEGPIVPWGRDEGILERAWSSRVTSKLFFFSSFSNTGGDRGELLEGYANLTVESVSVSPCPLTPALAALTALYPFPLQTFLLLLPAWASSCLRLRRADLA